jgi:hypothetical protein
VFFREKRNHPAPYNLSNETDIWQIFADQASTTFATMTGPLSGFYITTTDEPKQFKQQVNRADLHTGFLSAIFSDFALSADATTALDQLLSTFATAVGGFKLSSEAQSKTLNYTLKINTVPSMNITGDPNDPILVYTPTTTLVYMKIKATAWQDALSACGGTGGGAENFEFDMTYTTTKCQLNMDWYQKRIGKFDKIMEFCTGKSLVAYGASLSQPVLNK